MMKIFLRSRSMAMAGAAIGLCLLASGCGSTASLQSSSSSSSGFGNSGQPQGQVSLFMQDAPTDGVVAFNVTVSEAALFDAGGKRYPVLGWARSFELRQLTLASALVEGGAAVAPASFTSIELGLASPRLTLVNASGAIQQLTETTTPSVQLANPTISAPVTATLAANGSLGIMIDFDLKNSLSVDGNGNYIITPVLKPSVTAASGPPELSLTPVKITALQSGSMDAQVLSIGDTVHIAVGPSTQFDTTVAQFSSLKAGEVVEVEAKLQADGSYLATAVNAGPPDPTKALQGILMSTSPSGSNQLIQMVVR
ncbi:MAG: DUF4382 domain-containing protein [Acidobacteria bacterium]|nr:DUF4382 domain-containing protein [Acidobacteriota bacterium]